MSNTLTENIRKFLCKQQDDVLDSFSDAINQQYKNSVVGIVFYGSCMRTRDYKDAILDFYVVVDSYSKAYGNWWLSVSNSVLPPNVFYLQETVNGEIYRAKYAVVTKKSLTFGVSKAFHSYFWARFTQPMTYIYAQNNEFESWFAKVQSMACHSFYNSVIPVFESFPQDHQFWVRGLQLTYSAELRTETNTRAALIYENDREFYNDLFLSLDKNIKVGGSSNSIFVLKWKLRILLGKLLSVLRLMKATTTFVGGVDYIAWKIERHTGKPIHITNKMRKWPWIYIWPVVINLYKQGKIR